MRTAVRWGAVLLALGMGGCAFTPEKIDIAYAPTVGATAVPGADKIKLDVSVNDVRTNKERVGSKSNGYGAELAPISTNQDIVVLVHDALQNELAMRGYQVGSGDVHVICSIFDFANKFRTGFWSGTAEGSVRLQVKIRNEAGNTLFDEIITGQGTEEHIQVAAGRNAKPALEKALHDAMVTLMARQDFHQALLRAGATETASK
jgi:uncharacterized lipoprotein